MASPDDSDLPAGRSGPPPGQSAPPSGTAWKVGTSGAGDALLQSLVAVAAIFERAKDAEALIAGLPLVDNRLTPELFPRAAARAGLAAAVDRRPLGKIAAYTLPCVLLLQDRNACVLLRIAGDT